MKGSDTSIEGIPAIEDAEEHAGLSDEEVAEGSTTQKPRIQPDSVSCKPVHNQWLLSPFVNEIRGSSGKRSRSKWFMFRRRNFMPWNTFEVLFHFCMSCIKSSYHVREKRKSRFTFVVIFSLLRPALKLVTSLQIHVIMPCELCPL
jgi:hypothetical protein